MRTAVQRHRLHGGSGWRPCRQGDAIPPGGNGSGLSIQSFEQERHDYRQGGCAPQKAVHQFDEPTERLLNCCPIFLPIVVRDDLVVLPLLIHSGRIARKHRGELLLDDLADILKHCRFAPDFLRELITKPRQVDLAQVEGRSLGPVLSDRLRPNRLIHDPV